MAIEHKQDDIECTCDYCGDVVEELWSYEHEQVCADCIKEALWEEFSANAYPIDPDEYVREQDEQAEIDAEEELADMRRWED